MKVWSETFNASLKVCLQTFNPPLKVRMQTCNLPLKVCMQSCFQPKFQHHAHVSLIFESKTQIFQEKKWMESPYHGEKKLEYGQWMNSNMCHIATCPTPAGIFSWKNEASCRLQEDCHLEPVDNESGSHPNAKAALIWTAIIIPKVILNSQVILMPKVILN